MYCWAFLIHHEQDSVRKFYGQTPYVFRFTSLAEVSEAASSPSTFSVELVILPSDDGKKSEEDFVDGQRVPADVAGPMEVHEYRSDSEHSDADEDLDSVILKTRRW